LTDPDPNLLKSAAAYLVQVARSSKGGRYRKSAKIDALRECKEEILEAHRSGISIHRIAQIFRERNVDISTQHLMRAIRLFIKEGEGTPGTSQNDIREHLHPAGRRKSPILSVNRLLHLSGRKSLRSNCGWHAIWLGPALASRERWKKRSRKRGSSPSRSRDPRHSWVTKRG
jgi:hypothetical protein